MERLTWQRINGSVEVYLGWDARVDPNPRFRIRRNEQGTYSLSGDFRGTMGTYPDVESAKVAAEVYRAERQRLAEQEFVGAGI